MTKKNWHKIKWILYRIKLHKKIIKHRNKKQGVFFQKQREQLWEAIAPCTSLSELTNTLAHEPFFLKNNEMGIDHSEHLVKRIEIASAIGDVNLLKIIDAKLCEKFQEVTRNEDNHQSPSPEEIHRRYCAFLAARFPDLQLSSEEISHLIEKIPPRVFVTLDNAIERPVILLNTLAGTKSLYSCSGHQDMVQYDADVISKYYAQSYISFLTTNTKLIHNLESLRSQFPEVSILVEEQPNSENIKQVQIHILLWPPPAEWIKAHRKRTPEAIDVECKQRLETFFGKKIHTKTDMSREWYDEIEQLQAEYLKKHPELRHQPFSYGSWFIPNVRHALPEFQQNQEYREYYISDEAKQKRDKIFAAIENVIAAHRAAS